MTRHIPIDATPEPLSPRTEITFMSSELEGNARRAPAAPIAYRPPKQVTVPNVRNILYYLICAGVACVWLVASVAFVCAEDGSGQPAPNSDALPTLTERLGAAREESAGIQIIKSGANALSDPRIPTTQQAIDFLIGATNFTARFPNARPATGEVVAAMKVRNAANPGTLARILKLEAAMSVSERDPRKVGTDILLKAVDEAVRERVDAALLEVEITLQLAELNLLQS